MTCWVSSPLRPFQVSKAAIFASVCCGIPITPSSCFRAPRNGHHVAPGAASAALCPPATRASKTSALLAGPEEALDIDPGFAAALLRVQRAQDAAQAESDALDAADAASATLRPDWLSVVIGRERRALSALLGLADVAAAAAPGGIGAAPGAAFLPASSLPAIKLRMLAAQSAADTPPVSTALASSVVLSSGSRSVEAALSSSSSQGAPSGAPPPATAAAGTGGAASPPDVDRALLFRRMYPPGRLLHMAKVGEAPTDLASAACAAVLSCGSPRPSRRRLAAADCLARVFCCCARRVRGVYEPRWTRRAVLGRIRVSPSAAADHLPDKVLAVIQQAAADVRAAGGGSRWQAGSAASSLLTAATLGGDAAAWDDGDEDDGAGDDDTGGAAQWA